MQKKTPFKLPSIVFLFVFFILSMVQLKVETKMLVFERFFNNGGWIEIVIVSLYGAFITWQMQDLRKTPKWRLLSWTVFSIWFFTQLFLGILVSEKFLLTGKLHLPIPAMIISGPIFRGQLSVMTFLFLSTIVLTGPAWCSHLCYFGAIDAQTAKTIKPQAIKSNKKTLKSTVLAIVILAAILLRWFNVAPLTATILGAVFGFTGLVVIVIWSRKKGQMVHCIAYCPVGTIVNYLKYINPFRIKIESTCTICMACKSSCRYNALNIDDIRKQKPGINCILCGDCLTSCHENAIQYKLFKLSPDVSRKAYLFITISMHTIFLALGRI